MLPKIINRLLRRSAPIALQKQEVVKDYSWKDLTENESKRLGLRIPMRPDVGIFCERNREWIAYLKYHTLPGSILSAELFKVNNVSDPLELSKVMLNLLYKLVEIMEAQNIKKLEVYIASSAIAKLMISLGAKSRQINEENFRLEWNFEDMKSLKLRRQGLIQNKSINLK